MRVKGISWLGIGTDHYADMLRFFTEVMELEVEATGEQQAILRAASGQQIEIFGREGRGKSLNTPPTVAFEVDDVAAARAELIAANIEIVGDIGSWNGHEWLYFRSADGYLFEVKSSPAMDERNTPP
ncbi:MAG TPA: VOC family protein [Allosphingosinicella sp.]|jgi:catechol 2,3-dioxygenase-like lactoylglutathione lyase family enzyme|uniref:VOC family protein n=1 Tax=Allosphingosinicella sp. TaxID=2823234 RepID=UPI002F2AE0FE